MARPDADLFVPELISRSGGEANESLHWSLTDASTFPRFQSTWDRLNDAGPRSPLLDASLMQAALRHFGSGREKLAVGVSGGRAVAMALFKSPHLGKLDMFQPSQLPLGPLVATTGISLSKLAETLVAGLPFHCVLTSLTQLDPLFYDRPDGSGETRGVSHIETGYVDLPATADEYFNSRPKKKVAQVKKRIFKAEADLGDMRLVVHGDPTQVYDLVGTFSDMESAGWKGKAGSALKKGGQQERFYTQVLERFAHRGEMRICQLFFGDKLAAMQIAVRRGSSLCLLKSSYDETLKDYSPGVTLKKVLIEHLFEHEKDIQRIEFYGRLIEPHRLWITGSREIFHANVYRVPMIGRMHDIMRARLSHQLPDQEALGHRLSEQ